jgi:uncharacterized membrane protein
MSTMSESSYRRRLINDLSRWQENGWVTPDGAAAILQSLPVPRTRGFTGLIAILGAVLLGLGVLSLIAANWEAIPRPMRLFFLMLALGAAHALGAHLRARGRILAAEASMLLAGLIFAASIALIGQSYHLSGEFSDTVLLFAGGCLGAAFLAHSTAMMVLGMAGALFWSGLITEATEAPHWPGYWPVLAGLTIAMRLDNRVARMAAISGCLGWIALVLYALGQSGVWPAGGVLATGAVTALALWAIGIAVRNHPHAAIGRLGSDLLVPALSAMLLALFALQLVPLAEAPDRRLDWLPFACLVALVPVGLTAFALSRRRVSPAELGAVVLLAGGGLALAALSPEDGFTARLAGGALVLFGAVWVATLGHEGRNGFGSRTGVVAFGAEAIYLYTITLGTLLDTAVALFAGGLLFIAVSYGLLRFRRRLGTTGAIS